jgi:hypothetical protein
MGIAYSGIGRVYREIPVMQAQCGALSPFQKRSLSFRECCVEEYASLAKIRPQLRDILCKSKLSG